MPRDPHRDQPVLVGGAPLAEAAGALVLLHGRGGSAQDMLDLARDLDRPRFAWLVPEAAGRHWYPYSLLEKPERNRSHLSSALALLKRVLEKIAAAHVGPERVVLPKRRVVETATVFARLGATVTQRVYPGLGHAIHPDEIAVARGMLDAVWA